MAGEKYGYLKSQWQGFFREIDKKLKEYNDKCFEEFM